MAIITKKIENLKNESTYYAKVFTRNPQGRVNNRADLASAAVVPSETNSQTSDEE